MSDKPPKPASFSLIFSFRNEEQVLPEFIRRVTAVIQQVRQQGMVSDCELIFVNDSSSDRSLEILLQHACDHREIRIINMSRTFGVSVCVMAGLAACTGDAAIYMDCDLQDPPELIPAMLKAWQGGEKVEVVHTLRRAREGETFLKIFVTKIGYRILNRYCSVAIPREAGDFKLLSRRVINHLLTFKEHNPFMRGLICWVGFKQVFVPYTREARFSGKSKFFVLSKKVISNFLNSAIVNFSAVPLQIASYIGLIAILADIILALHTVAVHIQGKSVPGWTGLMLAILFLGGAQLLGIGMIGLYLNSVHEQTKMRPRYIIESTFGFPGKAEHA